MLVVWNYLVLAFSALLPLVNPPASALVFLGLVGVQPPEVYRSLARKIAINTVIFFAVIELIGSAMLAFFGISLPIMQVSGGLVIAAMGWSLLNSKDSESPPGQRASEIRTVQAEAAAARQSATPQPAAGESATTGQTAAAAPAAQPCPEPLSADPAEAPLQPASARKLGQKAFYPFTFPVTAGPGSIVVMLTLSAHAAKHSLTNNLLAHLGLLLAAVLLSVLVYFAYAYAPRITAAISPATAQGILRVVAFILLCIGVQIAWNGLSGLIATLPH